MLRFSEFYHFMYELVSYDTSLEEKIQWSSHKAGLWEGVIPELGMRQYFRGNVTCFQASKLFVIATFLKCVMFFLVPEALLRVALSLSQSYKIVACPALNLIPCK